MCGAGGGGLDEVVFSLPCFSRQFSTDLDQIDFANNFRGDQIDPLCLYTNITFSSVWKGAVCRPDRAEEVGIAHFHLFRQTESFNLSGWMFTSYCSFTKEVWPSVSPIPLSCCQAFHCTAYKQLAVITGACLPLKLPANFLKQWVLDFRQRQASHF